MMNIFNFNSGFEPNDIDSDIFLSEVPMGLMQENIKSQFENPLEYRKKDHIVTFLNRYKFSKENMDMIEEDDQLNLIELRDKFYAFMKTTFYEYLNVGIENFEDMSEEDQDDVIHYTYRFFITNIKKNFVSLVWNYINKNRDTYASADNLRKDITSLSFKKEITDPADIYILSNLSNIVDEILSSDISVDDFFNNCDNDTCLETRFMIKNYNEFIVTGNFVPDYIAMIDSDFVSEIESYIRNKILYKYKKKK